MRSIGVSELKVRTSAVLRRVRERREEIEVTHHGRAIARLVPVLTAPSRRRSAEAWSRLDRVAKEIGAHWPKRWSAVKAVREGRR